MRKTLSEGSVFFVAFLPQIQSGCTYFCTVGYGRILGKETA